MRSRADMMALAAASTIRNKGRTNRSAMCITDGAYGDRPCSASSFPHLLPITARSHTPTVGFALAHVSATVRAPIPALSPEVIDPRGQVQPDHCVSRAVLMRLFFGREIGKGCRRRERQRATWHQQQDKR